MMFDMKEIRWLQEQRLVYVRKDRGSDLVVVQYTPKVLYNPHYWTDFPVLLRLRGAILRPSGEATAVPFKRFFRIGQRPGPSVEYLRTLPPRPPSMYPEPAITTKMDGSLIICWRDTGTDEVRFATRKSFDGPIVDAATALWHAGGYRLPDGNDTTYLLEYTDSGPVGRVVVQYPAPALTLIGTVDLWEDCEWGYGGLVAAAERTGIPRVALEEGLDWQHLDEAVRPNFEGYVLHWSAHDIRVKVKLPAYDRIHKLITGMTEHTVWEVLRKGESTAAILAQLPLDVAPVFTNLVADFRAAFARHEEGMRFATDGVEGLDPEDRGAMRRAADRIKSLTEKEHRPIAMTAMRGQDWADEIWKHLEPATADSPKVAWGMALEDDG